MEHTRLDHSLSVVEIITLDLKHSFIDILLTRKLKNRSFTRVEINKRHRFTLIFTNQHSSKIEKRSCQWYASRTTMQGTQMSSSSTEQSRAAELSYFCARKSVGPVRHFEVGVQCAFENLAWQRHFTSQRLPTQHCSGSQWKTHEF